MLVINDVDVYHCRAKFKLTGTIAFDIGASELQLHIEVPKQQKRSRHAPKMDEVTRDALEAVETAAGRDGGRRADTVSDTGFTYTLFLDGERVPADGETDKSVMVQWVLEEERRSRRSRDRVGHDESSVEVRTHTIEFEPTTNEVNLNGRRIASRADFPTPEEEEAFAAFDLRRRECVQLPQLSLLRCLAPTCP